MDVCASQSKLSRREFFFYGTSFRSWNLLEAFPAARERERKKQITLLLPKLPQN
jgi:hypothetical protein